MSSAKLSLLSWFMFPVYAWQGIRLRRRIERLLPADIPQRGILGSKEPAFKILAIGDSTIASVGMDRVEDTFTYNVANALHQRTGRAVKWRGAGGNSATAADLRDFILPHIEERDFTHIIISVGTNDMKNFHAVRTFKKQFGTLLYAMRAHYPEAKIIWAPVPDMTKIPSLTKGLARVLSWRAALINDMGEQLCRERGAIFADPLPINGTDGFARDGFHPGPEGYRIWGEHLTDQIVAREPINVVPVRAKPSPSSEQVA